MFGRRRSIDFLGSVAQVWSLFSYDSMALLAHPYKHASAGRGKRFECSGWQINPRSRFEAGEGSAAGRSWSNSVDNAVIKSILICRLNSHVGARSTRGIGPAITARVLPDMCFIRQFFKPTSSHPVGGDVGMVAG